MNEISVILKNNLLITTEEFRVLDRYSCQGQVWTLVYTPSNVFPHKITHRTLEYIFDPEALTIFYIISSNVLATWATDITRNFGPDDELYLKDSLLIRPYNKNR